MKGLLYAGLVGMLRAYFDDLDDILYQEEETQELEEIDQHRFLEDIDQQTEEEQTEDDETEEEQTEDE